MSFEEKNNAYNPFINEPEQGRPAEQAPPTYQGQPTYQEQAYYQNRPVYHNQSPDQSQTTNPTPPYQYKQGMQYGAPPIPEPEAPGKRFGLKLLALLLVCTLAGGAIGGLWVSRYLDRNPSIKSPTTAASIEKIQPTAQAPQQGTAVGNTSGTMSTPDIVDMAAPATVAIYVDMTASMFGQTVKVPGSGSGVLISDDGYIVTNNHVVRNSTNISVTLADGNEYPADLVGTNEITDVAVIKIDADKALPYLKFGNSADLRVGETIIAIGNPLGELQGTVSQGIVSSLYRDIVIDGQPMNDLIQMDVAINSGNSGGALLNTRGELIGINVAKTDGSNVEGIAFAIPADAAFAAVTDILNGNSTLRPMIGILGTTVTEAMKTQYDVPDGVWVQEAPGGGPADKAGLQAQDVITAINGTPIASITELNAEKDKHKVGDELTLTVYRAGQEITLKLILGSSSY